MIIKINIENDILKIDFNDKLYEINLLAEDEANMKKLYGDILKHIDEEIQVEVNDNISGEINISIADSIRKKMHSEIENIKNHISMFETSK